MKKFFTICMMLVAGVMISFAQTTPERVLITTTTGQQIGALADRVADITFPTIEGRVACDIEIVNVDENGEVTVNLTRTADCNSFKFTVLSDTDKAWYNGDRMVDYINENGAGAYTQDYANAKVQGLETKPGTKYWVIALGYDIYNIPCEIVEASFTTPKPALVGNPKVTTTVTGKTKDSFDLHFIPNSYCSEFYVVAGEAGSIESQYNTFASWMGFTCFEDLIVGWGLKFNNETDYTYTKMAPGTDYDVYVLPLDVNGTYGQYEKLSASTLSQGGDGEAKVNVTLGAYEITDNWWDDELQAFTSKPSQMITFTPDENTQCYRYSVVRKDFYDNNPSLWQSELAKDNNPAMPIANWYQYEELTTDFQIDPETDFVVLTAGKNAKNEWGSIDIRYFTTPQLGAKSNVPAPKKIAERKQRNSKADADKKGLAPLKLINRAKGLRLE